MLMDILLWILTAFVQMVRGLFLLVNISIPDKAVSAIQYFVGQLGYLQGFINIPDILEAIGWFLTFTTAWYTIKLILWGFSLIPWFGKSVSAKI